MMRQIAMGRAVGAERARWMMMMGWVVGRGG